MQCLGAVIAGAVRRLCGACACAGLALAPAGAAVSSSVVGTTLDLLSFARWPGEPARLRLCVVGASVHADALLSHREPPGAGRPVSVRQRAPVDVGTDCDAVYLGRLPAAQLQAVYRRLVGRAELTIGERPEDCDAGAVFCLDDSTPADDFGVNLVSLARSGVRVDPAVLQLARRHRARAR